MKSAEKSPLPASHSDQLPVEIVTTPPSQFPKLVWAASGLSVIWLSALIIMAIFTANPVHLNQLQIHQAQFIVSAEVVDPEKGELRIEREFKFAGAEDWKDRVLTVSNLPEGSYRSGELYLIPLTQTGTDKFQVTEPQYVDGPVMPARVYPASDEVISDLKSLLERRIP